MFYKEYKVFILTVVYIWATTAVDCRQVHYFDMKEYHKTVTVQVSDASDNLNIFCYKGEIKNFLNLWKTVGVKLKVDNDNFELFHGSNESEVETSYRNSYSVFHFMPWRSKLVDMELFKSSCIGVYSQQDYSVALEVNFINFWKFSRMLCGFALYAFATTLSRNVIFYYTSGIVLGITASLLIVVYFISRLIPRKFGAVSVLVGGWATVLYVLQLIISNMKMILVEYQSYVLTYLVIVGILSFAICYRYGTVDERTQNLIKWLLQAIGLLLIFLSTEWREFSTSIVLLLIGVDKFPIKWKTKFRMFWGRRFPPKIKLLTDEEYHKQSVDETKKALESLRQFCNSPNCQSWKLMKKLNTPLRFAEFAEGGSHLSDEEILNYEFDDSFHGVDGDLLTDDEDSSITVA